MYKLFIVLALLGLACTQDSISPPGRDYALALGNPAQDRCDADHALIERSTYTTYYSRRTNSAEFTAWHLGAAWLGSVDRSTQGFTPDQSLPAGWYRARPNDYTNTGYDRGHLCPSADRTASAEDNESTFILSNVVPQAPRLNRETWEHLEAWCRQQVAKGNELYIVAGVSGSQGQIAGPINVATDCWKVILILPEGDNDLSRINATTPAFAVVMANSDNVGGTDWHDYVKSISAVQNMSDWQFFTNLPGPIRTALITKKYEPD